MYSTVLCTPVPCQRLSQKALYHMENGPKRLEDFLFFSIQAETPLKKAAGQCQTAEQNANKESISLNGNKYCKAKKKKKRWEEI